MVIYYFLKTRPLIRLLGRIAALLCVRIGIFLLLGYYCIGLYCWLFGYIDLSCCGVRVSEVVRL